MTPRTAPPTAPLVYLAEAIDRSRGASRSGYAISRALADEGLTVYRPATTWSGGHANPLLVEKYNRQLLAEADVILADMSDDIKTIGVPMEIEAATAAGLPAVVLWTPGIAQSVALQANPSVVFADSWSEAVELAQDLGTIHWEKRRKAPAVLNTSRDTLRLQMAAGADPVRRAYHDDAGIDLVTAVDTLVPAGQFVDIPTTVIGVQPPPDTWLMITGRSSTLRKKALHVPLGVIDTGWRGPLFVGVWNLGTEDVKVEAGDRLGQLVALHNRTGELAIVSGEGLKLDEHPRGLSGFGSTGTGGTPQAGELVADPGVFCPPPSAFAAFGDAPGQVPYCTPGDPELYGVARVPGYDTPAPPDPSECGDRPARQLDRLG